MILGISLTALWMVLLLPATSFSDAAVKHKLASQFNELGIQAALRGEWNESDSCFRQAAVLSFKNAVVFANKASLRLCEGKITESLELYAQAATIDSSRWEIYFNWGLALYAADSLERSLQVMQRLWAQADSLKERDVLTAQIERDFATGHAKADSKFATKAEIQALLSQSRKMFEEAKAKMRTNVDSNSVKIDSSAARKPVGTIRQGGAKASEVSELAESLIWIEM